MDAAIDLAQKAFEKYKTLCFFDVRDDFLVSAETLEFVIARLRSEGNRESFRSAAEISQALKETRDAAGRVPEENHGVDRRQ